MIINHIRWSDPKCIYDGEAVLGVLFKTGGGLAPAARAVKAVLSYQACDNESCLPPMDLAFVIAGPVSADSEGREVHQDIFGKVRFKSLQK